MTSPAWPDTWYNDTWVWTGKHSIESSFQHVDWTIPHALGAVFLCAWAKIQSLFQCGCTLKKNYLWNHSGFCQTWPETVKHNLRQECYFVRSIWALLEPRTKITIITMTLSIVVVSSWCTMCTGFSWVWVKSTQLFQCDFSLKSRNHHSPITTLNISKAGDKPLWPDTMMCGFVELGTLKPHINMLIELFLMLWVQCFYVPGRKSNHYLCDFGWKGGVVVKKIVN